jgi:hypothetical protein
MNLYCHASDDDSIVVLSTDGFLDQLEPPRTSLPRLIANMAAAFLSGLDEQKRGSGLGQNCLSYFNQARSLDIAVGAISFCRCADGMAPDTRKDSSRRSWEPSVTSDWLLLPVARLSWDRVALAV